MSENENTAGDTVEAAAQHDNSTQENLVPVHVVQSLRSENQQLKQNMQMINQHLELLKANQYSNNAQKEQQDSLNDHDVLTVGEAKKVLSQLERNREKDTQELKMSQVHSDYNDIITNYLPGILQEEPELRYEIENARNPYKLAYTLAKKSTQYQDKERKAKKNEDAERIIANSQKTGNLSAVGTSSSTGKGSMFKSMSDDEFKKLMNRNANRG